MTPSLFAGLEDSGECDRFFEVSPNVLLQESCAGGSCMMPIVRLFKKNPMRTNKPVPGTVCEWGYCSTSVRPCSALLDALGQTLTCLWFVELIHGWRCTASLLQHLFLIRTTSSSFISFLFSFMFVTQLVRWNETLAHVIFFDLWPALDGI